MIIQVWAAVWDGLKGKITPPPRKDILFIPCFLNISALVLTKINRPSLNTVYCIMWQIKLIFVYEEVSRDVKMLSQAGNCDRAYY